MNNSITDFVTNFINRMENLQENFFKDPKSIENLVYGMSDELQKMGLNIMKAILEEVNSALCKSGYRKSKWYDPEVGRFISDDGTGVLTATPLSLTDKNPFAYCGNNPVNRVEPSGQFWISAIIKEVVVVVAVVAVVAKVVCTVKETKRVQKELDSLPEPTADITESFRETLKTNANTVKATIKNEGEKLCMK